MKKNIAGKAAGAFVAVLALPLFAAEWIAGPYVPPAETNAAAFFADCPNDIVRRKFVLPEKRVVRAMLRVAAPGMRDISLNGCRVTSTALPPFTPYSKRVLEETFDVTEFVRANAENELRIELGNGWWNLLPLKFWYGLNLREHLPQGTPCVKAVLEIGFADGSATTVGTDGNWESANGRIVRNSIYTGETVDARRTIGPWRRARVVEGPAGKVAAAGDLPKTVVYDRWPAKSVERLTNGAWRVDFGVNFAGTYRARLRGVPRGATVTIRSGERVFPDGRVNTLTAVAGQIKKPERNPLFGVAEQCERFVSDGATESVFEPRMTFHAFRYVEVEGLAFAPRREDFEALAWSADVADAGAFECSNADLNRLHEIARRTFRANMQGGVQSDCPGREKFGYGGDIAVTAESFRSNYAMAAFYRKVVRDFIDEAAGDGLLTETAPYVGLGSRSVIPPDEANGRLCAPMGWALGLPKMLDVLVRYDGDLATVREAYPTLVRFADIVARRYPDHAIPKCLGDWIALEKADESLSALCSWHEFVAHVERFAKLLGKTEDGRRFGALKAAIADAFRTRYLKPNGVVNRGVQGEQLYALHGGLLPDAETERAACGVLLCDLSKRGHAFTTGITTLGCLFEYLGSHGHAEAAGRCLTHEGFPGFRHLLSLGATTLWESFDETECADRYSNCHPMFGSYEAFFTRYILGIRVTGDAIGGDKVIIEPHPVAGVTWARGHLDVAKGRIEVAWKLEDGLVKADVRLPDGVMRVYPKGDPAWAKNAEDLIWNELYSPKMQLVYDYRNGEEKDAYLKTLPTPEEIREGFPIATGWDTGMEDSVLNGSPLMLALLKRCEKGDASAAQRVRDLFEGLAHCAEVSGVPGYLARSISPLDGKSFYANSSRDQYTLFVYAMWRFFSSPLARSGDKSRIRKILGDIAGRCEAFVNAEHDWSLPRSDGGKSLVCSMWTATPCRRTPSDDALADYGGMRVHEALRLPEMYAAAYAVTGDRHWREQELKCADQAIEMSMGPVRPVMNGFAVWQMAVSARLLWECESDPDRKTRYLKVLERCADLSDAFAARAEARCLALNGDYSAKPGEWRQAPLDYYSWAPGRPYKMDGLRPLKPRLNARFCATRELREMAECVLVPLLCPGRQVPAPRRALFESVFSSIDYRALHVAAAPIEALLADALMRERRR